MFQVRVWTYTLLWLVLLHFLYTKLLRFFNNASLIKISFIVCVSRKSLLHTSFFTSIMQNHSIHLTRTTIFKHKNCNQANSFSVTPVTFLRSCSLKAVACSQVSASQLKRPLCKRQEMTRRYCRNTINGTVSVYFIQWKVKRYMTNLKTILFTLGCLNVLFRKSTRFY